MSARQLPMPINPALWIIFGVEHYPFGLLTMIVSLEAIFLSTFVMISQNRADEKRQVLADHQWQTVQEEEQQNEQLLALSNQILELTKAIHAMNAEQHADRPDRGPGPRSGKLQTVSHNHTELSAKGSTNLGVPGS